MNLLFRMICQVPRRLRCHRRAVQQVARNWRKRVTYNPTVETLEERLALSVTSSTIELRQFDFNTANSPNQSGWTSVKRGDLFNQTVGFGWETPALSDTYDAQAPGDDVVRDGHLGKSAKFQVLVKPGTSYDLELIFRDKRSHQFQVSVEGSAPSVVQLPQLATVTRQFPDVISTDNILTVQFSAPLREDFIINGLRISGEAVILNAPPTAIDDVFAVDEDTQGTVNALANDFDRDGDPLTLVSLTQPANGKATFLAGSFTYKPKADFFGTDSFRYTISDGKGGKSSAVVSVTVNSVNDKPIARDDLGPGFQTTADTSLVVANVLSNDSEPDTGDALKFVGFDTTQTLGTVTANNDGTIRYVPPQGYVGTDSFRYTVSDNSGETASATVAVTVRNNSTSNGIWISNQEIMALPTSGIAWQTLLAAANSTTSAPDLKNQDDNSDVYTLAKALVGVRLGNQQLLAQARANILAAMGTEVGGRSLALGRNLASFVIAADLVGFLPQDDAAFRAWLRTALTEELEGRSIRSAHEDRPNNWGTMSGASRAAIAVYLGDVIELDRTATVFKGYLGDRNSYANFDYGTDLSWQANPTSPVGINPKGTTKDGHSIDGVLPDDLRRGGSFTWPPLHTGYPWEALQGAMVQAEILHRAGYNTWQWQDQALLRAVEFLQSIGWDAEGDDQWQPWLINARYSTHFVANPAAKAGKIMGWTAWTHQPLEATVVTTRTDQGSRTTLQTTTTIVTGNPIVVSVPTFLKTPTQPRDPIGIKPSMSTVPVIPKSPAATTTSKTSIGSNSIQKPTPESLLKSLDEVFGKW